MTQYGTGLFTKTLNECQGPASVVSQKYIIKIAMDINPFFYAYGRKNYKHR